MNQQLRRLSVQRRIAIAFLLLTLALALSVPLLITNHNFLVHRLNDVTDVETRAERLLLLASVRVVESRVDLDRYIDRFTPSTSDAQDDILQASAYIKDAKQLVTDEPQLAAMEQVLHQLDQYHTLIAGIDKKDRAAGSLPTVPARTFPLLQNIIVQLDTIAESSRIQTQRANDSIQLDAQQRLRYLLLAYGLMVLGCSAIVMLVGRTITKPIYELHAWALNFREGTTFAPISTSGNDELTELALTLNGLTARMAASNLDLEQQVADGVSQINTVHEQLEITQFSVDYSSDAVFWILPDGSISYANHLASESLGYSNDELLSMALYDIVPHLSRERWDLHWQELKNAGTHIFESSHITKSGATFPVEVRTNYQVIEGQEYIFGFTQDITERKANERSLYESMEAAEAANLAKSQFLSNMTHELRTPMNGVLGLTSLLYDTPLNEEQLDIVNTIRSSGDTLLTIINQILDFSKLEANKVELDITEFDLHLLVGESLGLASVLAAEKSLQLDCEIAPNVPHWVLQDAMRIRQVLSNLLSNAVKFTDSGNILLSVEITSPGVLDPNTNHAATHRQLVEAAVGPSTLPPPIELTFSVQDTGIGIPPDRVQRLFQSFSQVDASTTRRFGGTGLGLAISKHLVDAMGGEIGVQSEEGKGATFFFTILVTPSESKTAQYNDLSRFAEDGVGQSSVNQSVPNFLDAEELADAYGQPTEQRTHEISTVELRTDGCNDTASNEECEPRGEHRHPLTILAAEDNLVNQKVLLGILRKLGYSADLVPDGRQAFEAVAEKHYDLVLMDINMPEMDGITATEKIRSELPSTRQPYIIAVTANAMLGDRERFIEVGMNEYVSKPIQIDSLQAAIEGVFVQNNLPTRDGDSTRSLSHGVPFHNMPHSTTL